MLKRTTADLLHKLAIDELLNAEGMVEGGFNLADDDRRLHIDIAALTGHSVTVYGQSEITRDLIAAAPRGGIRDYL